MKKVLFLLSLALLLMGCGGNPGGTSVNTNPTPPPVNGFGIAANHVHSMVALPDAQHTLVLATHYGIFRSQDQGATWQETAGEVGQLMHGVMTYNLSYNLVDPQRLYVLTFLQGAGKLDPTALGLYTSSDAGKTWQLSTTDAKVSTNTIVFAQAGNESPAQVYIYLRELGPQGLRVSMDNGQHFTQAGGTLPFGSLTGLLAVPDEPGHLVVYGNEGIANTTDGGKTWQVVKNIQGSIFEMSTPGARAPIYASGDAGIYVSHDGGASFNLAYTQHSYSSLSAAPEQPDVLYGKLGLGVYRSLDGGKSWSQLPAIKGNLQVLVADPTNAQQVFLAISFPTEVYLFQAARKTWQSITPPVAA